MTEWNSVWHKLAKQVAGKEADELEVSRWVFENYLADPEDIEPDDIPSPGAVGLLMHLRRSESNYNDFLKTIRAKLLPNKTAIEFHIKLGAI